MRKCKLEVAGERAKLSVDSSQFLAKGGKGFFVAGFVSFD
jgi:hypothetical protein